MDGKWIRRSIQRQKLLASTSIRAKPEYAHNNSFKVSVAILGPEFGGPLLVVHNQISLCLRYKHAPR